MRRNEFLKTLSLGAAGFPLSPISNYKRKYKIDSNPPNILFITTDYQAAEDLPATGSSFLDMPNIDRLCREGVTFKNHYCSAPISMPARYTLITGQYPHTHGQWENLDRWVPDDSPILMQTLAGNGYQTAGIGKMHFYPRERPRERMAGFDMRITAEGDGNNKGANDIRDDYASFLKKHNLTRWSYLQKQWVSPIFGVYDWPYAKQFHIDHFVGEQTASFIENNNMAAPWFNWVSFTGPHNPWNPPAEYSAPYKQMNLPEVRARSGELENKPADHTRLRYGYTRQLSDQLEQASSKEREDMIHCLRAGYYGELSLIDEQIGKILESLEKTGQLENTIIIFSSDHGCQIGDHHLIHKAVFYERSAAVPFIIWAPSRFQTRSIESFFGHVDFFPTIISLAGLSIPDAVESKLEGADLTPLLEGRQENIQAQAFNEIRWATSVVDDRWKLSVYPRDGEGELYDRKNDPDELYNLFEDPGYLKTKRELLGRLEAFHPHLANQIADMRPFAAEFLPKTVWELTAGQHLPSEQAPYQREKSIHGSAQLTPSDAGWENGPILKAHSGNVNGYAFYINDGRFELGLRRWNSDTVINIPESLPERRVSVEAQIQPEGMLTLWVESKAVSGGKAGGGLPKQQGNERILAAERLSDTVRVGPSP